MIKILKKYGAKIGVLVVIIIGIAMVRDSHHEANFGASTKKVEINGSSISGYKDGVLSWGITADYVWAGRSKYLFRAQHITDGKLYDNEGRVVVKNLNAYKVRVNTKSKTLSAFKNIEAHFVKRDDREKNTLKEADSIIIFSNELRYFGSTKRTYLYKNVKIVQDEAIIYPVMSVEVDNNENIATLSKGFRLESKNYIVTGNKLTIFIDDDKAHISKGLEGKRPGKVTINMEIDERERALTAKDTFLFCDDLWYTNVSENRIVNAKGNIEVFQGDKRLKGDAGYYNRELSLYELEGNVMIRADDIRWLLKAEDQMFKNEDILEAIDMPVTINAKKLSFNADTKELKLYGPLSIIQPNKIDFFVL